MPRLQVQRLWLLPGEVLVGEVAILRGLVVDRLDQVELLDDNTRPHVEVLANDLHQLLRALVGGSVGVNVEREWLSDADCVGELDKAAAGKFGMNERLGDPASEVGSTAIDLAVVLAAESATAMGAPTAIGVDDDLAACETCVTLGSTDDEESGWLDLYRKN